MKKIFFYILFLSSIEVVIFFSCQREIKWNINKPPIALAGPDQVITLPTDSVLLDGSTSSDPDGKISEWLWTKISGPTSFNIIRQSDSIMKVKTLVVGTYQFELKVTDNGGLFAKDTVQVFVNDRSIPNRPPVANAGMDQTITLPTNTITLNGNGSTDPDNNITSYLWTKISGPSSFNIINANAVQTQVINLVEGIYKFELKITDGGGLFSKDTMQVTIISPSQTSLCADSMRTHINAQLIPFGTLSQNRYWMSVANAGNKIVFAGGHKTDSYSDPSSRVDIYDMFTQTWTTAELSVPRYGMAVTTAGNKIFFAGGAIYDNGDNWHYFSTVDIYDASTNTWSVTSLSEPRGAIAAATVGNKVFFAGGEKDNISNGHASDKVDIYDLSTNTWSTELLNEPRSYISALTVNNKIYFAGGSQPPSSVSDRIDIYDNTTNSWTTSSLSGPKSVFAGISVADKIYWAGGYNGSAGGGSTCIVEIKDVNTWNSSIAYLFKPGEWWSDLGENAVVKNNKIVFLRQWPYSNGQNNPPEIYFDIYDISTGTWSIGELPASPITTSGSIISVNNIIYVTGGWGYNSPTQVWKLEF